MLAIAGAMTAATTLPPLLWVDDLLPGILAAGLSFAGIAIAWPAAEALARLAG